MSDSTPRASADPLGTGLASRRKCLLFAASVLRTDMGLLERIARRSSAHIRDAEFPKALDRVRGTIEVIERAADGRASDEEETAARESLMVAKEGAIMDQDFETAVYFRDFQNVLLRDFSLDQDPGTRRPECHIQTARELRRAALAGHSALHPGQSNRSQQAVAKWQEVYALYLADIFQLFPQSIFVAEWRTDTAVSLAAQMYESRDFSAMPILADALQDAGCDNEDVLAHCRDPEATHIRGCWVIDLVLGKE